MIESRWSHQADNRQCGYFFSKRFFLLFERVRDTTNQNERTRTTTATTVIAEFVELCIYFTSVDYMFTVFFFFLVPYFIHRVPSPINVRSNRENLFGT